MSPTTIADVRRMLALDDWDRVLLGTFYMAFEIASYRRTAHNRELYGPAAVRSRIRSLERALRLDLVREDGTGHALTEHGRALLSFLRPHFGGCRNQPVSESTTPN